MDGIEHIATIYSRSVYKCPIYFQNNLWDSIHHGDYNRLVYLTDFSTDSIWFNFALPQYGEFVPRVFRNCLQTLLYTSDMGKDVFLDNGLKMNLDSADGSTFFYWAVVDRSKACVPDLQLRELRVEKSKKMIAQHLLHRLLVSDYFEPTLADGIPILHILISLGHHYERPDQSVDLFELYISRHPDKVELRCPWTGSSTLEALQSVQRIWKRGMSYQEDQIQHCISGARGSSSVLPRTHIHGHKEIGWREETKGITQLRETLALWRRDEDQFREKLKASVMTFDGEEDNTTHGRRINGVMKWLRSNLEGKNKCNDAVYRLEMSGSVGENSKILPMDEIDLLLQVWLDVEVEVKEVQKEDIVKIRKELSRPIGKQPVKHLVRLLLRKDYPNLGQAGEHLTAKVFGNAMEVFVSKLLRKAQLPPWLRCPEGKHMVMPPDLLERTKAGLMLNLEYEVEGEWHELSVDLVAVLVLSKDHREKYLKVNSVLIIVQPHDIFLPSMYQNKTRRE